MQLDTSNFAAVSRSMDGKIFIQNPLPLMQGPLTDDQALTLAAWLVALTDPSTRWNRFHHILDKVLNS